MNAGRPNRVAFGMAVASFAMVAGALQVVRIVEPLGIDQGLFLDFARWVPRGWLPYRDIFDSKPPLFLYWWALSAAIPGNVIRAAWWLENLWLAGTLGAAYVLVSRVWGRWAGLASAALLFVGLWSPAWGGFWSRAQAEELLTLPMLASAWFAWRAVDRWRAALWAGVLAGVCGLFKIPSMAIVGAWGVTWLACTPPREAAKRIALLLAGVAAPWGAAFAWFAAHHAVGSFVEGVFVYHRYNTQFIAPPWSDVILGYARKMLADAQLPLGAAALGIYRMVRNRARELRWVAPWAAATMAAVVLERQLAGYHYLLAIPALSVAGGYGLADLARMTRDRHDTRAASLATLGALLLLFAREAETWWRAYSPDAACLAGRLPRDAYLRSIQPGAFSMATEEEAGRYLREHTAPSAGILVWGLSPGIYAIADRHPVTRYPFHKILMTDAPLSRMWPGLDERRARFMEGLRADPPEYVLVGRHDANGFEPHDSFASMMRFPEFRDFVRGGYRTETQIGAFVVFRRVDGPT